MVRFFFYDMDDTLIFTRDKWLSAIDSSLASQGLAHPGDLLIGQWLGKNCRDICREMAGYFNLNDDDDAFDKRVRDFRRFLLEQFEREDAPEIPGAGLFIKRMQPRVAQYIVSGSPAAVIENVIQTKNWELFLSGYRSSDMLSRGKPDPAIYTKLRDDLGASNDECLIFEDSPAGVEAAKRAGLRCVCIRSGLAPEPSSHIVCEVPDFLSLDSNKAFLSLVSGIENS